MRRFLGRRQLVGALALAVIPATSVVSQATTQVSAATPAAASRTGDPKKVLNLADYGRWNRITSTSISPDGKWMTYAYQPNDGDVTLYVKEIDGSKLYTIAAGAPPQAGGGGGGGGFGGGGANTPVFSDDSRFVGYYVNPPGRPAGRGRPGGTGTPTPPAVPAARPETPTPSGQGGAGQRPAQQPRRFELLDLKSGEKFTVPNPATFQFS